MGNRIAAPFYAAMHFCMKKNEILFKFGIKVTNQDPKFLDIF